MTSETRFFRSDNQLLTTNTVGGSTIDVSLYIKLGIKVYYDAVLVSGSDPVAQANIPLGLTKQYSGTWTSATSGAIAQVKIELYGWDTFSWTLLNTWITDTWLPRRYMTAALWTVYYWNSFILGVDYFSYGSAARNSRIENFSWSATAPTVSSGTSINSMFLLMASAWTWLRKKRRKRVASAISSG